MKLFPRARQQATLCLGWLVCLLCCLVASGCGSDTHSARQPATDTGRIVLRLIRSTDTTAKMSANESKEAQTLVADLFQVNDGVRQLDPALTYKLAITSDQTEVILENVPASEEGVTYDVVGRIYALNDSQPLEKFEVTATVVTRENEVVETTITSGILKSITISPASGEVMIGYTTKFSATGKYSDDTTQAIPPTYLQWKSSAVAVATIDEHGICTGVATGTSGITATDTESELKGTATITVTDSAEPAPERVVIFPPVAVVPHSMNQQYTATAEYADGTKVDCTKDATWSCDTAALASMDTAVPGRAVTTTTGEAGDAKITATYKNVSGQASLSLTDGHLDSLNASCKAQTLVLNASEPVHVEAVFLADGDAYLQTFDVTDRALWTSDKPDIVAVSDEGVMTAKSAGTATITAAYDLKTAAVDVTVTDQAITTLYVHTSTGSAPEILSLPANASLQYIATATINGVEQDYTDIVSWQSSDPDVARIYPESGKNGLVLGIMEGSSTQISATIGSVTSSAPNLAITSSLVSLEITPDDPILVVPSLGTLLEYPLQARAVFADGTKRDVSTSVNWHICDDRYAKTVSPPKFVGSISYGSTPIYASWGNVLSNLATFTVTDQYPDAIKLQPNEESLNLKVGDQYQLQAIGEYNSGLVGTRTYLCDWTSNPSGIASVGAYSTDTAGLVKALAAGDATITVTDGAGALVKTITIHVTE